MYAKMNINWSPIAADIINSIAHRLKGEPIKEGSGAMLVKDVIYNDPATIVLWSDGTKTVVKCQPGDEYDSLKGFLMCVCKKFCGNKGNYNEVLKKFVPGYGAEPD